MTVFCISASNSDPVNVDGVNLAQHEIQRALTQQHGSGIVHLPEDALLYPRSHLSAITDEDTVYCNLDPFAWLIYLAREEVGRNFRICRNVQTGPWNGYLLQEWLCRPLGRPRDVVFYISDYAREGYQVWLPGEPVEHHISCYPEVLEYPNFGEVKWAEYPAYRASYVGRLSRDKGFDIVMDSFEMLHEVDKTVRFRVAGAVHPDDYSAQAWSAVRRRGESIGVEFSGPIPRKDVFTVLRRSGALLFPSTSNVESLGRILLEAGHSGTPVVAAAHAQVPRMLDAESMVSPNYCEGLERSTGTHFAMGKPSAGDIAEAVNRGVPTLPQATLNRRRRHWVRFLGWLQYTNPDNDDEEAVGDKPGFALAGVTDLPTVAKDDVMELAKELRGFARALFPLREQADGYFSRLKLVTTQPERTDRFIRRAKSHNLRFDDVGGVSMEACHLLGFAPTLRIGPLAAEGREDGELHLGSSS